jgi:ketosteroid isomerase-like protein
MKRWLGVSLILSGMVLSGCSNSVDPLVEISEVKVVLDRLYLAQQKEDMTALSALFLHDEDLIVFGIAENEHYVGWIAIQEMFQKQMDATEGLKTTLANQVIKISKDGKAAWVSSLNHVSGQAGENRLEIDFRSTVVLEKHNGKWLIVHIHLSKGEA